MIKLNEWADFVIKNGNEHHHTDDDAYSFGYNSSNEFAMSDAGKNHRNIKVSPTNKYAGRVWLNEKILSFWQYPESKEDLYDCINLINSQFLKKDINANVDNSWNIEFPLVKTNILKFKYSNVDYDKNESIFIKPFEYSKTIAENPLNFEFKKQALKSAENHMKSPSLKNNTNYHGFGSTHKDYMSKASSLSKTIEPSESMIKMPKLRSLLPKSLLKKSDYKPSVKFPEFIKSGLHLKYVKYNADYKNDIANGKLSDRDAIDAAKASYFIDVIHYIHKQEKATDYFFVMYDTEVIGVLVYGQPTYTEIRPYIGGNLPPSSVSELRRLVLANENDVKRIMRVIDNKKVRKSLVNKENEFWYTNAIEKAKNVQASEVIKMANDELKKIYPNLLVVVSYADSTQGHEGNVYKASITKGVTGDYFGKSGKLHLYVYYLGNRREQQSTRDRILNYPGKVSPQNMPVGNPAMKKQNTKLNYIKNKEK